MHASLTGFTRMSGHVCMLSGYVTAMLRAHEVVPKELAAGTQAV